jgi:hypothetical protein
MIPYDDLVVALATWRARQGLPIAQLTGTSAAPPPPAARAAPPSAPPRTTTAPHPQVAAEVNELEEREVSVGTLIEDGRYDPTDDEFSMALGVLAVESSGPTAIGGAPEPSAQIPVPRRGQRPPSR